MKRFILASSSPRRKELLSRIIPDFEIYVQEVDEKFSPNLSIEEGLLEVSLRKGKAISKQFNDSCIISADTVVIYNHQVIGKPQSKEEAFRILTLLSGNVHQVYTGVTIIVDGNIHQILSKTKVKFFALTQEEIWTYIMSEEPMDKAGAYGIQEKGGLFVESIEGDFYNVVGFPMALVARKLRELHLIN